MKTNPNSFRFEMESEISKDDSPEMIPLKMVYIPVPPEE